MHTVWVSCILLPSLSLTPHGLLVWSSPHFSLRWCSGHQSARIRRVSLWCHVLGVTPYNKQMCLSYFLPLLQTVHVWIGVTHATLWKLIWCKLKTAFVDLFISLFHRSVFFRVNAINFFCVFGKVIYLQ